jgi:hypothetical protein
MISLNYCTGDAFSLYGIQHFIEKTGINFEINRPCDSGIEIAYGIESHGDFLIKIIQNDIQNHICGKISVNNEKIPLCEIPHDTGSGTETIAYFETAEHQVPCLTRHEGGITLGIDIFKETGYLLSGHLDTLRDTLDATTRRDIAAKPMVDALEDLLYTSLLSACRELHVPLVQKSYWPDNKSFAVCLTHDVDEIKKTYQYVTRPLIYLINKDWQGFNGQIKAFIERIKGTEPYWTFEDIFMIEKTFSAKSTYFILKESGRPDLFSRKTWSVLGRNRSLDDPRMHELVGKLLENGDEIGIHGSYFSYKNPALLRKETRELEQLIKNTITGTRQHHLNLDIPATWEYQVQAGLKYDSSLGFRDTIGFRWGTSFPFFPHNGKEKLPILEIPLIIMEGSLSGFTSKEQACLTVAEEVRKYHGVLSLLWHPRSFNPLEYPGLRDVFIAINRDCQDKDAWITGAGEIYSWVSFRNLLTYSCSYHDSTCTIVPGDNRPGLFFTLYLPDGLTCSVRSGNADIIRREENYITIKTHHLTTDNEIVMDIA